MNILREVRKAKNRSMPVRIILLLTFCLIFIVTTYAWFSTQKNVTLKGLSGDITPWYVAYYINNEGNEYLDETVTFTIDQLYPGMPEREDAVHIFNMGSSSTKIEYRLLSVKVFGQEVLNDLDIGIVGNTTTIFPATTESGYPFEVSYTYDKDYLKNEFVDNQTTPESKATFKFNVKWKYEDGENATQIEAKDILDTKFGKDAYAYYKNEDNDPSKAIEIKVRITSKFIHPSLENN